MLGAADRARRDGERDLALAHTTASMIRAKKLEGLDRYLPPKPARTAKPGAMLGKLMAIAAATGGRVEGV